VRARSITALVAALGLLACGDDGPAPPVTAPPPEPPRLVVMVIIDQLPSWSFARDVEYVRRGIHRLVRGGTYVPTAMFPYAATYTAPGHAALATGAPPARTGILANRWRDRKSGQVVEAIADPTAPVFTLGGGLVPGPGVSGARLRVEGVADVLERETGGAAHTVSIGLKDRSAALALGRRPDLAIWYEPDQPAMTTSRAYADAPPEWLVDFNERHRIADYFDQVWRPADAALLARATGIPDEVAGEGGPYGLGASFPHDLGRTENPARALRATPFAPRMIVATALAAVEALELGADEVPDLLALSLSSHDYAGHSWGQESWERLDLLLAIDEQLGLLFDELDRRIGADRYAVILTSDHGAVRLVEHTVSAGRSARRIPPSSVREAALEAARPIVGDGDWIADIAASTVYLSAAFRALPAERRERALAAMIAAIEAIDGIALAARTDELIGDCERRRDLPAVACRSLDPDGSGEIFVATEPDTYLGGHQSGTSHGTANPDDRAVPIIIYVPGRPPRTVHDQVSALRVAPTLARLLGIPAPEAALDAPLDY
jgi:predicted AlkP superfamily pyrophosphatase or phosphodiesterase